MNDLTNTNLRENITQSLLCGDNPQTVSDKHKCDIKTVLLVMGGKDFLERSTELLEKSVKSQALRAINNIAAIANNEKASDATRLKANMYIADRALDMNAVSGTDSEAATMTQDQLAARLKELQSEAIKRAKPIDGQVIDQSIDDMLE